MTDRSTLWGTGVHCLSAIHTFELVEVKLMSEVLGVDKMTVHIVNQPLPISVGRIWIFFHFFRSFGKTQEFLFVAAQKSVEISLKEIRQRVADLGTNFVLQLIPQGRFIWSESMMGTSY